MEIKKNRETRRDFVRATGFFLTQYDFCSKTNSPSKSEFCEFLLCLSTTTARHFPLLAIDNSRTASIHVIRFDRLGLRICVPIIAAMDDEEHMLLPHCCFSVFSPRREARHVCHEYLRAAEESALSTCDRHHKCR